ncbi:MAG: glycoside hydrolase family 2 TIM barrel-domain containing protein [Bacteroidales bacterium]
MITLLIWSWGCTPADPGSVFSDQDDPRIVLLLDDDWLFSRGDHEGAETPSFNDASWRQLNLPHDWSIEDIPGTESPLDSTAPGGISTGYYRGGTGWYRKMIDLPGDLTGKRFFLQFDGIYMNADVWVNGSHLGNHPYGYTSFWYDISDQLKPGQENQIAVRVRNEGRNSRWYSGSGIYRHVWLTIAEPVHVVPWGTRITTPEVGNGKATVMISNEISNRSGADETLQVEAVIFNEAGDTVAKNREQVEVPSGENIILQQQMEIPSPTLWSVDDPHMYGAVIRIENDNHKPTDLMKVPFGIRTIEFTTDGFFLNGKNIMLKGGCMHHDNGPLGAAAYDRAEERRVELMKASGFNAIRCAHNPPSPAFLDACDRLGMLVIDEAFDMWRKGKNPEDYHLYFDQWWQKDITSMIRRDDNHPSIIMWSIGNEIPERADPEGVETSAMLADFIRGLDPSRPVTSAVNGPGPDKDPYFATLDVSGYNYSFGGDPVRESVLRIDHNRIPDRIMYCSESFPLLAYGAWMDVLDNPFVVGDFVWTGFDYLGEASIGWLGYPHEGSFYPWNHAYCGDIDICGMKRPQSYYRNVLWNSGRLLSLFVTPPEPSFEENPDRKDWSKWHWHDVVDRWNWPGFEEQPLKVEVYSAYEEVELLLNGESLGKKLTNRESAWIARWKVPYRPGELEAIAYRRGEEVDRCKLVTASLPDHIVLLPDRSELRADGQDLSFITVELRDADGHRCTTVSQQIEFEISGPGTLVAVGSSDPTSTESFQQPHRKAYQGRCLVVIKSTREGGEIQLTARAEGLNPGSQVIVTH